MLVAVGKPTSPNLTGDQRMSIYYVYAYLREDRSPYYIGKGKGLRAFSNQHHKIKKPINRNHIIFIKDKLSEKKALELEIALIKKYGRKDLGTGILRNMTNGGEGISGYNHTIDAKKKISKAHKNKFVSIS
jgi:hypothetical protein